MKIASVTLARVIGFIETADLNPQGRVFLPHLVPLLVERFGFLKYPQAVAEFDEQKGVVFSEGHANDVSIDNITIWHNGIQVDTRTSTDVCERLLHETLEWLRDKTGLIYEREMIKRWAHLSSVTFYSDAAFGSLHPGLKKLCANLSGLVSGIRESNFDFDFAGMSLSFDRWNRTAPVASFLLQRRADTPFSDHKYYSEAPLPTDMHIKLLEEFEADILDSAPHVKARRREASSPEEENRTLAAEEDFFSDR